MFYFCSFGCLCFSSINLLYLLGEDSPTKLSPSIAFWKFKSWHISFFYWDTDLKPPYPESYRYISSVQFSGSVVSDSLQPHESQRTRPPCPSPTPRFYPNLCTSSRWCHLAISSSGIPFYSCPQSLPASVFSNESTLCMRWPKYWSFSFSISPFKEHPGLIFFRMDYLDLLAVQGTLKSSPTLQFKSINSSVLSFLHSPTLTSTHDHWKNHSLD